MSYTGPRGCATKGTAWTLVGVAAALLLFNLWFQVMMIRASLDYRIPVSWGSESLFFLVLVALVGGTGYAARKGSYGLSVAVGAVSVAVLGWMALMVAALGT